MKKINIALIMAGGKGVRLGSKSLPKAMYPLPKGGKPAISFLIEKLYYYGIRKFYISAGHKKNILKEYFTKKYKDADIYYIGNERNSLEKNIFIAKKYINESCLLYFSDNYSNININDVYLNHLKNNKTMTLVIKKIDKLDDFGRVLINKKVIKFIPGIIKSKTEFIDIGIHIVEPSFFDLLKDKSLVKIKQDLAKKNQMNLYNHIGVWYEFGTKERYNYLCELFEEISRLNLT